MRKAHSRPSTYMANMSSLGPHLSYSLSTQLSPLLSGRLPGFLPLTLAPAFPLFLGSINAFLQPTVPFVLTEHSCSPCPACLLQGSVLPDCPFPTQAQREQTKSELNMENLGVRAVSRKDKVSERKASSSQQACQGLQAPSRPPKFPYLHPPGTQSQDLRVVLGSSLPSSVSLQGTNASPS